MHAAAHGAAAPRSAAAEARRSQHAPGLAIVTCVKSTSRVQTLNETALVNVLIPSLTRTISPDERSEWHIALYLCADDNDDFFVRNAAEIRDSAPDWLGVRLLFYPVVANRVPSREAAAQAFADGAEYLHRTNDDIEYLSQGWVSASVGALRAMRPPNLGVVGPRVYGDGGRASRLLTVDLVHRTHLTIFHEYYPPQVYLSLYLNFIYVFKAY